MDRILEAHYAPPSRNPTLQKEKAELLKRSREVQDPTRSVRTIQAKHAKPVEKSRTDSELNGKGLEKSSRGRQSLGRSRDSS